MSDDKPLGLFEGYGIELEYMIVRADTLDVLPICDRLLEDVTGEVLTETEQGELAWSNELCMHVVELKTNGPRPSLAGAAAAFQADIRRIDDALAARDARLMPGSMHPWMDPAEETVLWPHEHGVIYRTFDRIFGCEGHGWSNIQSMHVNLPFADDEEFGRLHAAIRLVLPLLPALAASSPVFDGLTTGVLDNRLDFYRRNARAVPAVAGDVVPERVFTRQTYERDLLGRIYHDLAPSDPDGVLRHEWVNGRGAIARFERMAIEIRLIDIQECPAADLATAALVSGAVQALTEQRWSDTAAQRAWEPRPLDAILRAVTRDGERAVIEDAEYLATLGLQGARRLAAGEVWHHLLDAVLPADAPETTEFRSPLGVILQEGPLSRRLLAALGARPHRDRVAEVWLELCQCLREGRQLGDLA